jgi:eukaryotic translation initiation factor 2C
MNERNELIIFMKINNEASDLTLVSTGLLHTFNRRNGSFPKNLVIFRDGVGDGMFPMVKTIELSAIRNAVNVVNPEAKISVIVCQKRHNSRFVYKDNDEYINPCPGLVFDSYHNEDAITSVIYNEFFLNSHVAIQGTAKPCRYNLLHDEIGKLLNQLLPGPLLDMRSFLSHDNDSI